MAEAEVIQLGLGRKLDFVAAFMDFTDGIPSPELFRLWAAISAVAGALERRVWAETSRNVVYPNLYVMLVASPSVGKSQAINPAEELWGDVSTLRLAPHSSTAASMLDDLIAAHRVIIRDGKLLAEYHSLIVPAGEFSVFCPAYDLEFLGRLNHIYECPRSLRVSRKYFKEEVNIVHPQLNILAGAQPGLLGSMLPEEAWSMGFMSRMIMIYAGSGPTIDLFGPNASKDELRAKLLARMNELALLQGKFFWEKDAALALQSWHAAGGPPKPAHSKLAHYAGRRTSLHVIKLCIVASASRGLDRRITLIDVQRAIAWLLQAEQVMPDIFREMVGKSDGTIIRELHYFMWKIWVKEAKAIHESRLVNFLKDRVPHEKVLRIIEVAERARIIEREHGANAYRPVAQEGQIGLDDA